MEKGENYIRLNFVIGIKKKSVHISLLIMGILETFTI